MNLGDVMDQIGVALDTIPGLRVYDFTADDVAPPAGVVSLPERIDYGKTYKRGLDSMDLEVTVLVGAVSDRASRDEISDYADGSGSKSVKAVAEAGTYTACDSVTVRSVEFDVIALGGVDYLAAVFRFHVEGQGA